jgi:ferredoxin-NADP reductase
VTEQFTAPPSDLYGRPHDDRLMRALTAFGDFYSGSRRRPRHKLPPRADAWLDLTVTDRVQECDEVISLRLARPDRATLPRWHPGSHLRLELPSGRVRHYSLCGDPADRNSYVIAIRQILHGGGGSIEIHDELKPGSTLRVLHPRNGFPFAGERSVLFIAGGIGITPVLPMAAHAAEYGLDWRLVYTGRSRTVMPFLDRVTELGDRAEIRPDDEFGVPDCTDLLSRAPAGTAVYVCGPRPVIDGVRGLATGAVHFERFTAPPVVDGHPFQIELRRSGAVLEVPADRSALDVLLGHDPSLAYSCRQGFCGTCVQHVISGKVDHHDQLLIDSQREAGDMLVCVSRAPEGERLVLDL